MQRKRKCDLEAMTKKSYILVTGGSGGIGSAVCRLCPSYGFTPIIGFNINSSFAKTLAKDLGGLAVRINMDDQNSILAATHFISEEIGASGPLIGVVLGASPPPDLGTFLKISQEQLSRQINVNLFGPAVLLQWLIKTNFKKDKSGTIVGILSEAIGSENEAPVTGMGSYVVAKSALKSLLTVCSAEYPWLNVKTVSPGFTKTPMLDVFDPRYIEIIQAKAKISSPEAVAQQIMEHFV